MFNWFKWEVNQCRGWRCDKYCLGCKIERYNCLSNMYNVEPLPTNNKDHKTICEAFRSTRYPFPTNWDPDILGVYNIVRNKDMITKNKDINKEDTTEIVYENPMLLYFGVQRSNGIDGFLREGLDTYRFYHPDIKERIELNNSSFQAINNFQSSNTRCRCTRNSDDVIYVIVFEVPNPSEAKVFGHDEKEGKGKHPFEKHEGEYSLEDNLFYKDSKGRGLSRGLFPAKLDCAMLKGTKLCDVFSVERKLVKPAYLIAVRLPCQRW